MGRVMKKKGRVLHGKQFGMESYDIMRKRGW